MIEKSDPHYRAIQEFYGDRAAKRSGIPYMHHIDEGLVVLDAIQTSLRAKQAYCLHPIVQLDDDLTLALEASSVLRKHAIDPSVLMLAMEYRRVANGYSSRNTEKTIEKIRLSHLNEVNDMLIGDKVQNRADFERFHQATHPRSQELSLYFGNWLRRLGVTEEHYHALVRVIREAERVE